jgi:sugar lactone lactonase YvrE
VLQAELLLDAKAELGEGPSWLSKRGRLLWVNIAAEEVHMLDPASGQDAVFEIGQPVGAAVPAGDGLAVLAVRDGFALLDLTTGLVEPIHSVEKDRPNNRMNDGKCDSAGRFWAGTMAMDFQAGAGSLYRLDRNRRVEHMIGDVSISNGLGWSPDDSLMYYIDTPTRRVDVFDFDAATGTIENRRRFVTITGPGSPDGMAVDAEGGLWVGLWDGGHVLHFLPDGSLAGGIELPVSRVTSCCFGGPDLTDLYITTAWQGLRPEQRALEPLAGGLFQCRPGVTGQPTQCCQLQKT